MKFIMFVMFSLSIFAQSQPGVAKSFREWYYADGIILPNGTKPENEVHGSTSRVEEFLVIANFGKNEASATITYYFENDPPRQAKRTIPARASKVFARTKIAGEDFPYGKLFGARVASVSPIMVQATRAGSEEVPEGQLGGFHEFTAIAYQGPLGKRETKWTYPDGHISRKTPGLPGISKEWITILNPNPGKDAKIRITFNYAKEQKGMTLLVPAERIRTIALHDLELLNTSDVFYPVVESDIPVVVEQVRRPHNNLSRAPRSGWTHMAIPIGDVDFEVPTVK
jgi:hypothetical protein